MNSLIIPVYKNAENIPDLLDALAEINLQVKDLEVVFVVDGSPDSSAMQLAQRLPTSGLTAQLLLLSRNFGSFAAIREGMKAAQGERFAVLAADLQEPPDLPVRFFEALEREPIDLVIATRESRADPFSSRIASSLFWKLYKRFIAPEIPDGGVDVFACNLAFRDQLLQLDESHSSLVALLFWMGYRRKIISYSRLPRLHGKSAWTFSKKLKYFKDSVFSFTDLPIKLLTWMGSFGIVISVLLALITLIAKLTGHIVAPGYSATVLTIVFFGALNLLGLGVIGTYAWRAYENTKRRPSALVMARSYFSPEWKRRAVGQR